MKGNSHFEDEGALARSTIGRFKLNNVFMLASISQRTLLSVDTSVVDLWVCSERSGKEEGGAKGTEAEELNTCCHTLETRAALTCPIF